jgi:alpha-mannosidase
MKKPTVHLICNAHLDPVWQWRWEEGCAEALSTFGNAVDLLKEHGRFIFNHNEAILYQWVRRYDPALFRQIQKLVREGRWCISGGWYLQPDVNIPGTESLIRHILVGRQFFREHFDVEPRVAYNFDSFGHSGGLPQILRQAGYEMYIHMRPWDPDLKLPSDLYRWRGVDGSEILAHRIAIGYYHTEYDNLPERLEAAKEMALRLQRDVPVFWGLGNHGGGATRNALEAIDSVIRTEGAVNIIHSTTEKLYDALKRYRKTAPVVQGDLQRVFTGCYTSLARVKRRAQKSLAEVVQLEALRAWAWHTKTLPYPDVGLEEIWRDHLFNDFHDILPGSAVEPAELDALDQYGKVSESLRRLRLDVLARANADGRPRKLYIPLTVWNTNPGCRQAPVEVECVVDLRPKWKGEWHLRLASLEGGEIVCQEEQPESVLPFAWRRKIVFMADLPQVGCERYKIQCVEGSQPSRGVTPLLVHKLDEREGFVTSLDAGEGRECLAGRLLVPLVVADYGDAWGNDCWKYREVVGHFKADPDRSCVAEQGPIRTVRQSVHTFDRSSILMKTISYSTWPVIEYNLRINWNETRKRLKLSIPTVFKADSVLCEVPGGAIRRPADGEEHVQGRWCMLEGTLNGRKTGFALINSGQHGFDFQDGELRLSVLRSAVYCHDKGQVIVEPPTPKFMDQGVHEVRLLITAGDADAVRDSLSGLADWLSAPPVALTHLPIGTKAAPTYEWLSLEPAGIRLLAVKRSNDGRSLVVRLQETTGFRTKARLGLAGTKRSVGISFRPYEIKTFRVGKGHMFQEVTLIDERLL